MKAHTQIEALFADYDRLSRSQERELAAHAAECPACAARLADYRRMEQDFTRLRDPLPGPQLDAAIHRGLAGAPRPWGKSLRLGPAPLLRYAAPAAVLLVLAAAWLLVKSGVLWDRILPPRAGGALPAAHSALVGSFVWQRDGAFGYQMLRPTGWTPVDESQTGGWRAFAGPGWGGSDGSISMMVANLEVGKDVAAGLTGDYAIGGVLLGLFEQDRTLPGWTAAFEQEARGGAMLLEQVRALPDAKIYMWNLDPTVDAAQFVLVGLKVNGGKPLAVIVSVGGAYADLESLQREGFVDDLATMLESARAIPADPKNVVPWLANATPGTLSLPVPEVRGTPVTPPARSAPALMMTPTPVPTADNSSESPFTRPASGTPGVQP